MFSAGGLTCKWKESQGHSDSISARYTGLRVWSCYDTTTTSSTSPSTLVATLSPPQAGALKAEVTVFERGRNILEIIVFTAIVVSVGKAEWRNTESAFSKETLQSVLKGDARGFLPPYAPVGADGRPSHNRRISSVGRPRRPRTAGGIMSPPGYNHGSESEPPPYASRMDFGASF